jgi:hypothetical protein
MGARVKLSRIPRWFGADAIALTAQLILLHPSRAGDQALIAHEREHCAQIEREGCLLFWLMYLTSREQRLDYEVDAYRVQIAAYPQAERPARLEAAAGRLARSYWLRITIDEARELLQKT